MGRAETMATSRRVGHPKDVSPSPTKRTRGAQHRSNTAGAGARRDAEETMGPSRRQNAGSDNVGLEGVYDANEHATEAADPVPLSGKVDNVVVAYGTHGDAPDVMELKSFRRNLLRDRRQAVIKVEASTVSRMDCQLRRNMYHKAVPLPVTAGCDFVGTVVQMRDGNDQYSRPSMGSHIHVGDRVCAVGLSLGGNARYAVADIEKLLRIPSDLDPLEVVCLLRTYVAAYQSLHRVGDRKLEQGDRVLVTGGSGCLGQAVIQLAKAAGASEIFATTEGPSGRRVVERLGARPIRRDPYKWLPLLEGSIDVAVDSTGVDGYNSTFRSLNEGGKLVVLGDLGSSGGVLGNGMGSHVGMFKASFLMDQTTTYDIFQEYDEWQDLYELDLQLLFEMLREGTIEPNIVQAIPLSEVCNSHEEIESGGMRGHIVCVPSGEYLGGGIQAQGREPEDDEPGFTIYDDDPDLETRHISDEMYSETNMRQDNTPARSGLHNAYNNVRVPSLEDAERFLLPGDTPTDSQDELDDYLAGYNESDTLNYSNEGSTSLPSKNEPKEKDEFLVSSDESSVEREKQEFGRSSNKARSASGKGKEKSNFYSLSKIAKFFDDGQDDDSFYSDNNDTGTIGSDSYQSEGDTIGRNEGQDSITNSSDSGSSNSSSARDNSTAGGSSGSSRRDSPRVTKSKGFFFGGLCPGPPQCGDLSDNASTTMTIDPDLTTLQGSTYLQDLDFGPFDDVEEGEENKASASESNAISPRALTNSDEAIIRSRSDNSQDVPGEGSGTSKEAGAEVAPAEADALRQPIKIQRSSSLTKKFVGFRGKKSQQKEVPSEGESTAVEQDKLSLIRASLLTAGIGRQANAAGSGKANIIAVNNVVSRSKRQGKPPLSPVSEYARFEETSIPQVVCRTGFKGRKGKEWLDDASTLTPSTAGDSIQGSLQMSRSRSAPSAAKGICEPPQIQSRVQALSKKKMAQHRRRRRKFGTPKDKYAIRGHREDDSNFADDEGTNHTPNDFSTIESVTDSSYLYYHGVGSDCGESRNGNGDSSTVGGRESAFEWSEATTEARGNGRMRRNGSSKPPVFQFRRARSGKR